MSRSAEASCQSSTLEYPLPWRCPARDLPGDPVVDIVDDGLTEDEIAARFAAWLAELDLLPTIAVAVSAADELRRADADNEV